MKVESRAVDVFLFMCLFLKRSYRWRCARADGVPGRGAGFPSSLRHPAYDRDGVGEPFPPPSSARMRDAGPPLRAFLFLLATGRSIESRDPLRVMGSGAIPRVGMLFFFPFQLSNRSSARRSTLPPVVETAVRPNLVASPRPWRDELSFLPFPFFPGQSAEHAAIVFLLSIASRGGLPLEEIGPS